MKPKTKLQKLVVKLSAQLPKFTEKHRQWAIENVVDRIGHRLNKGIITCTQSSEVFPDTMKFAITGNNETNVTITVNNGGAYADSVTEITIHRIYLIM